MIRECKFVHRKDEIQSAIFHKFIYSIPEDSKPPEVYCIIEISDGTIRVVPYKKIKFIKNPLTEEFY